MKEFFRSVAALKPIREALARAQKPPWHLVLDKLCGLLEAPEQEGSRKTQALQCIQKLYEECNSSLKQAADAKLTWLTRLCMDAGEDRFRPVVLRSSSPLLVHLAHASVLENVGLSFERTAGLPIIPGTAVKGLVSTWTYWTQIFDGEKFDTKKKPSSRRAFEKPQTILALRVLGDDRGEGSESAGAVIFLGGFPVEVPKLGLDIVNPHHTPQGQEKAPTPNLFLALEPGATWMFPLLVRRGAPDPQALLNAAERWLCESLTELGIGAKTAAGYGRFQKAEEKEKADVLEKMAKLLEKATIEREKRLKEAEARRREEADAKRLASLPPEERDYQKYCAEKTKDDWTRLAAELPRKSSQEKEWILRYFRSPEGKAVIKSWPKNEKAKKRLQNLKDAGL